MNLVRGFLATALALGLLGGPARAQPVPPPLKLGVAQVDVTPDYPVRLSGFGFRRTEY